jgi:hypothetical protein
VNLQQLKVECELRVTWDTGHALAAVCKVCWDHDSSLAANGHSLDTDVPSFDDFTGAKLEAEWLAFLVC